MKTILFHAYDDDGLVEGLENALSLARATGAHLKCVHAAPTVAYAAGGAAGAAFAIEAVVDQMRDHVARIKAVIEKELDTESVPWEFVHIDGDTVLAIAQQGALADLIVAPRFTASKQYSGSSMARHGSLLFKSRTPIFIPAEGAKVVDPNGTVLVAWDGSFESANAVRGAVDLLKLASKVQVIRVDRGATDYPDTELLEYLSRHGIHAELKIEPFHDIDVVPVLLGNAERMNASMIVLGGYSHSRLGEWFFGGVTRDLLKSSPVGLVMAH